MTSPIDPIRNTGRSRRTLRPKREAVESGHEVNEDRSLPVVTGPAVTHEPEQATDSASVFKAQLMGQDGQKRYTTEIIASEVVALDRRPETVPVEPVSEEPSF